LPVPAPAFDDFDRAALLGVQPVEIGGRRVVDTGQVADARGGEIGQ
jgi:hypothetical protein